MRIVIDLQGAQTASRFRGVGRYSLSLAKAIVRNAKTHEVVIVLNSMLEHTILDIRKEFEEYSPSVKIRIWGAVAPTDFLQPNNGWRRESAEILREAFLASLKPDIVVNMSMVEGYDDAATFSTKRLFDIPTASVFYDVIPLIQSEQYLPEGSAYKEYYLYRIEQFKSLDLLLAISDSSRREAIEHLGFDEKQVVNIGAAVSKKFTKENIDPKRAKEIVEKYKIKRDFVLITGATDERKNHLRLIEAFTLLPKELQEKYQLVIAGGMPYRTRWNFIKYAKKHKLSRKKIIFTDWVSDEELLALYSCATLFVYPSWHEGFGLPVLEAMQCGVAVIGSNNTSIPEIIGDADALFDPFDVNSIAQKIEEYLRDDKKREELKRSGLKRSQNFSWDICGKKVVDAIEQWYSKQTPREHAEGDLVDKLIQRLAEIDSDEYEETDLLKLSQAIAYNHPSKESKQLFVDISELVKFDAKSGIQRVVRNILRELISTPPHGYKVEPVYATTDKLGYYYAGEFMSNFSADQELWRKHEAIELGHEDIFLGLDMSPDVQNYQQITYTTFREFGIKIYFVVHDLLPVLNPQWWTKNKNQEIEVVQNFERWLDTIIENNGAICVSHNTANDLKNWIQKHRTACRNDFQILVSHNGADIDNEKEYGELTKDDRDIIEIFKSRYTFLMVGTLEPRKGQYQVLKAFETLWSQDRDINLVIVGKQGWVIEDLVEDIEKSTENGKRLFWLNSISDSYLEEVYKSSTCLIVASEGEGFGLPLIEAAQHKLPIIARDLPVFREVAQEYAYYCKDSKDPDIFVKAVEDWIELYERDEHPKSDEMPWLSWGESKDRLLEAIGIV